MMTETPPHDGSKNPLRSLNEAQLVQNTALCSIALWLFVREYVVKANHSCPLPLCFTVLPIVLHYASLEYAVKTNPSSAMSKFLEKFKDNREELLAIHNRMIVFRPLTLRSLQLACSKNLLSITASEAGVKNVYEGSLPPSCRPERIRKILSASEKLGKWYAPHSVSDISMSLRLSF